MSNNNCFGFQAGGGSGGGSIGYIDITYDVLFNTIVAGGLVPGQKYRLTDYVSLNWLNGLNLAIANPTPVDHSFNPRDIYSSQSEVLLLEAISYSEISPISYSEKYPQDIVEYFPLVNSFGLPLYLAISNGYTLPDSSIVSGFDLQWDGTNVYFDMPNGYPAYLGQDFYLGANFHGGAYYLDAEYYPLFLGINEPTSNYSTFSTSIQWVNNGTRIILNDLTYDNYLDYEPNSLYVQTLDYYTKATGRIVRRNDTINNVSVPFDFRNQIFRRYEISTNSGLIFGGIGDTYTLAGQTYATTGNFEDAPVFKGIAQNVVWTGYGENNAFLDCLNCTFSSVQDVTVINNLSGCEIVTFRNTLVLDISTSTFTYSFDNYIENFYDNNLKNFYGNNLIGEFSNNSVGNNLVQNTLTMFQNNVVGNNFVNNNIGAGCIFNIFANQVTNNVIKTSFTQNIVGNFFNKNGIEDNCTLNNFGDSFNSNKSIQSNFRKNTFCAGVGFFDFSLATLVYLDFQCIILQMDNGTFVLTYTQSTGPLLKYKAVTD